MSDLEIKFSLLGPIYLGPAAQAMSPGSPQQQALLVVLLLRVGQPVAVSDLVTAIWDDDPPKAAIGTLRTYVSRLRQLLREAEIDADIDTVGGGYALRTAPNSIDTVVFRSLAERARGHMRADEPAAAFAALTQALSLWKGPPLGGVPGRYAEEQRTRLAESRLAAEEMRHAAALASDAEDPADLVSELTTLAQAHPLREGPHALLMRALYRAGRQVEALEVYHGIRGRLNDELGLDPGHALGELQRRILSADPSLHPTGGAAGPATDTETPRTPDTAAVPGPSLLPADLHDFTGREAELDEIVGALVGGPRTVGVLGVGGIGRTATAVRAAHRMAYAFPGGRFYADMARISDPSDLGDLLASWLRALEVTASELPAGNFARAALLQRVAADRRMLVVLDNVDDHAEISWLREALPGCSILVTAQRRQAYITTTTWVTLGGLLIDDGVLLLERLAGPERVRAEPEAARRLVTIASGWPLPLRLLGCRLAARPRWGIAAIGDELQRELSNLTGVVHDECVLAESPILRVYRQLPDVQASALRMAATRAGEEFSTEEVAALLDVEPAIAWSALDALVDLHLLFDADTPHRFGMNPIVRAFGRRQAHLLSAQEHSKAPGEVLAPMAALGAQRLAS
ncbi:AfsR/SARP family transcriptional regulator [Asanoa siamensis]|uniref:OmpR/PhoB-type domain-containing protein n=1 Tax=Asanoa siamensis TaxID=926357 RepID=A0ABQ4D2I5_9ACTN|nr:AfsR/SARP family transcriptional regulator [Asanoa siamensis]GIF77721.1 hypothetical protein Asi02nite_72390 [Asanoa siamensis]